MKRRLLEIQWAPGLFDCLALDRVGVDHGGPYIAVAQEFLYRPYITIGLQQVTGKTVAECMRGGAFT